MYRPEPEDPKAYTAKFDLAYTRFGRLYDQAIKALPVWKNWLNMTLPYIEGPRVLEISIGTGYLMTRYAGQFETFGIDLNQRMTRLAAENLKKSGLTARLQQADVYAIPYAAESFDTVVNTMALSGYPDGRKALEEISRVLKVGGGLVLLDVNYPADGNPVGVGLATLWASLGDILRDMEALFKEVKLDFQDHEIGGSGSIHLYIARK